MTEPLRILTTEIQPWRFLKDRAESDLGFPLEFIEMDFNSAQRSAALDPASYDIYDQCFHNLDIVWYWRAVQAIDTRRITHWDDLGELSRMPGAPGRQALGDIPASRLFVQHDMTLSNSPTGQISMLPTFYNFDSFAVETTDVDVDRDIVSWAELLNPKWAGRVALVDEPAIGLFDLAMALAASGQMSFENMGNMSVEEIDALSEHARSLILSGHLSPFWLRANEPVERFLECELKLASIWSPTIVEMKRQGVRVRQAHPREGYRAWHGGMCLSRVLEGEKLDRAYEWLNWYLDGYAGAVVARQGYYMSVPERVKAHLPQADWAYWYEGQPAAHVLKDVAGRPAIRAGETRSGGSREDRCRHIAIWNSTMDEHNYVVRRWNELVDLAATKARTNRRASQKETHHSREDPMKNVTLIATGGTIASSADKAAGAVNAGLTGEALLRSLRDPLDGISVLVENFEAAGSYALDLATIHHLCRRIDAVLSDDAVDGVVVTHGTDTMEESAFLAWLLTKTGKPVVFTGAQRHAGQPDTDGPRNIHDAICAAASAELIGVGPVILFEGDIHGARYVTKAHTSRVDTFRSIGHGKLGEVDHGKVHLYTRPAQARVALDTPKLDPNVELIGLGLGSTPRLMGLAADHGASGIVLSAFGRGNAPKGFADEVARLVAKGCVVAVASRCQEGRTRAVYGKDSGGVTLVQHGALLAGDLSAVKTRLLLSALLGAGLSGSALSEAFARYI